ncbi:MAG: glutamine--tRNA ligase/YqeY domain fusion protein [Alphaproteobacteria bacterium]|nr:glutamine--tRNA ligase/YqeY domain fusion protein [Alphaproteobacteria bacterium]
MSNESTHFIRARIEADRAAGRWGGRVATRFPPEPNGYLHIGHAKAICLNFGLAAEYGGTCNLRFDDTNPETEDPEFVDNILADVRWLGFEPTAVFYASDYFAQLYAWAEQLVRDGKAYVDDQSMEAIRANRGTVTEPGTPSPWRDRSVDDNLALLRQMKAGDFPDGSRVLRARIDMAHPNMKMRDPLMYRIRHAHHYRTGDAWCIYPMYDWAHGQSDAIEGITHSICTLEFDVNRELYDWFTAALGFAEPPNQLEFARLNLTSTVMSKRFFKRIVADGFVDGWDDPRMPTLAGLRRRGVPAEALRAFAERVGVAKANSVVDLGLFEFTIRDVLNHQARRRMGVLDPLEVVLTNWPQGQVTPLEAADFPADVGLPGSRTVPMSGRVFIERSDFAVDPPDGWRRLRPGGEVRLRYGYVIRCDEVVEGPDGQIAQLRCSVDLDTLGKGTAGRKVKGVIHWVSADHAVPAEVRLYDRLFTTDEPGAGTGDYLADLNPNTLSVKAAFLEPSVTADAPGVRYQLERHGYVYRAPEDADRGLVFNRIVGLKDTFGAKEERDARDDGDDAEVPAPAVVDPRAQAEAQARIKAQARLDHFTAHPEAEEAFQELVTAGASDDEAWTVASDPRLVALVRGAAGIADIGAVARWIANTLVAEARDRGLDALPFDGAALGRLVALVEAGTLNARLGKQVLAELLDKGGDPKAIAEAHGWIQVSDTDALGSAVAAVMAGAPDEVARYKAGEKKLLGFFMGQVMAATGGKANPGLVRTMLQQALDA